MRVTALDLATVTGVAFGQLPRPEFATWTLRAKSRGQSGLALMRFLTVHLREFQPEKAFIEAPANLQTLIRLGATGDTILMLNGLIVVAETVCAANKVPTELVTRQTVLKHFLGHAPKAKEAKPACLARCRQLGWSPANDNEGDAAALWDYGCASSSARAFLAAAGDRPAQSRRAR